MTIQFRQITWYSKLLALALFVALPFIGFYFGSKYGALTAYIAVAPTSTANFVPVPDYYHNVAAWQTDGRDDVGFEYSYLLGFNATDSSPRVSAVDWRLWADGAPGKLYSTLTIPRVFEPQSNFNDAKLTVGASRDQVALKGCLIPPVAGELGAHTTTTVNGTVFSVYTSTDAGAGNLYDVVSYRALHSGTCWAIEYTIHSAQLGNYPPEYQLHQFDKARVKDVLERIVGTFRFL